MKLILKSKGVDIESVLLEGIFKMVDKELLGDENE